ncbi:MAG TPA: hypothetical protein VHO47_02700 [Candidatus Babeliales bacterium]|nr:hypothetical protein [Candidatus Babeliales bacterium]
MAKKSAGFATLMILIMIAFILLYTSIVWQSVGYLDELATAHQQDLLAVGATHALSSWAIGLTKHRFDQIMQQLATAGHKLLLPIDGKKTKLTLTNAELGFSKKTNSCILLNGTINLRANKQRSFSCTIEKRATEKPDEPTTFIVSGYRSAT